MAKARNMLAGQRYNLGASAPKAIAPYWVHLGVVGSGIALGYIAYPYAQQPLGMTLMGAAGSIAAVGILLLVYDLVREKSLVETMA
jgi:hypothetical protein